MAKRAVTYEEAVRIKEMYAERDVYNRPKWSLIKLGKEFGYSETTIYRIVNSFGSYMRVPEPEVIVRGAADSLAKLFADPSVPISGITTEERIAQAIRAAKPADLMVEELSNGSMEPVRKDDDGKL